MLEKRTMWALLPGPVRPSALCTGVSRPRTAYVAVAPPGLRERSIAPAWGTGRQEWRGYRTAPSVPPCSVQDAAILDPVRKLSRRKGGDKHQEFQNEKLF
eukprot:Lithocolla_globosa_v1_NODE_2411_length_2018_cov_7.299542.p4 type:complete len:100 gc:universal NODE_2411_length_2018_cov_7.299542:1402-1103(-)